MFELTLIAHVANRGDISVELGQWLGEPGSRCQIEGIAVVAKEGGTGDQPPPGSIEYQLAYDNNITTPWTPMPQFCGSRGLGVPARGVQFRLSAAFAERYECIYSTTFIGGEESRGTIGPHRACQPSGAAVEAIHLTVRARQFVVSEAREERVPPQAADQMLPPPGGESPWDDPSIRLRLLSPGFASAPPLMRNQDLIPAVFRRAMAQSWDRNGFADRTLSLRLIENAYAVHEGLVLDQNLNPVPSTVRLYADSEIAWARDRGETLRNKGELRRVTGTSLLCKSRANNNYGHFLIEMFPKAWIGRHLFGAMGLNYIVQQNDILLVTAEATAGIGINPNALVWTDNDPVICDRLLVLDGLTFHGQYQSPLCTRALQDMALATAAGSAEKIFVSRRARTRPLLNEDRVEAVLRERGFVTVEPGRMRFAEQIALFKGARVVVGALGAALTNIAFCAPGTKVVALTAASFPDTFFWFQSLHGHLDYREIRGADAAPNAQVPWDAGFSLSDADFAYLTTL